MFRVNAEGLRVTEKGEQIPQKRLGLFGACGEEGKREKYSPQSSSSVREGRNVGEGES